MSDASYLRGVEVEGSIRGYRRKGACLTRERHPEDMRYLLQQSFVLPGLSVKQVFDDFGVAFESFVEDFPDFVGTARKRMKTFSTGSEG